MTKNIKIGRYRAVPYTVNYPTDSGGVKTFQWSGSKGNKKDIKEIPEDVVNYLMMNSICFEQGELVIADDSKEANDLKENIDDKESYDNNTQSRDEIVELLKGNMNKMKSELNKITVKDQKKFVVDTAKEIELDSDSKKKFIADWYGVKKDILFSDED